MLAHTRAHTHTLTRPHTRTHIDTLTPTEDAAAARRRAASRGGRPTASVGNARVRVSWAHGRRFIKRGWAVSGATVRLFCWGGGGAVSYTHLRAHEPSAHL
eukprot:15430811-Alexandrium_andersonii.AAC.1